MAWEWVQLYKPNMLGLGFIPVVTKMRDRQHWAYPEEPIQALCDYRTEVEILVTAPPGGIPQCRACSHSNRIRDRWEELSPEDDTTEGVHP